MSGGGGGTFNIGSQQAGAIYQAGGDQVIHHGGGTLNAEVIHAVSDLHSAVAAAPLSPEDRAGAERSLAVVDEELKKEEPDKGRIAGALEWVAGKLEGAGALAGAAEALKTVGTWLGPAGATLLGILV
ncbi:MAG TPA: DUF5955 family protein [Thermoleophilaceae bacterium]|nr:DUF5955 family protein [Thermoleophilaceae bacterium]